METGSAAADIEKVVLRMEQELDPVEWNRDDQRIDVIPDTAEDMGPGVTVCVCVCVCVTVCVW